MAITLVHDCDIDRRPDPQALNGDFRDTCMDEIAPDNTHDANQFHPGVLAPGGKGNEYEHRALLLFDLTKFIPASATITAAVWWLYVMTADTDTDHAYYLERLTRADWKEAEATWNSYKTGSSWTNPGGDFGTPPNPINLGAITTTGWKNYDVIDLVSDAWDDRAGICTFIMRRVDDEMTANGEVYFHAKNYQPYGPETHHLRITYILADRTFQVMVR